MRGYSQNGLALIPVDLIRYADIPTGDATIITSDVMLTSWSYETEIPYGAINGIKYYVTRNGLSIVTCIPPVVALKCLQFVHITFLMFVVVVVDGNT